MLPRLRRLRPSVLGRGPLLVLAVALASVGATTAMAATAAGRITYSGLGESSSLAISKANPGIVYTANDTNPAIVYAVRISTGAVVGRSTLSNVKFGDTEAMSLDRYGRIWLADLGADRTSSQRPAVYRFAEQGTGTHQVRPTIYPIVYPGGRHYDVEAFVLNPRTNDKYILTKARSGSGKVFQLPSILRAGVNNLVAARTGALPQMISDASFSPDGKWVVARDNKRAHVLDPAHSWRQVIPSITLPSSTSLPNPESLSFDVAGTRYLVGSEGLPSRLYWIPFIAPTPPAAPAAPTAVAGDGMASVSWDVTDWGNGDARQWTVATGDDTVVCSANELDERRCDVTGLVNGTPVQFKVRASTSVGVGPWSDLSAPVTPAGAS